jgi:hypothetical protein
MICSGPVERLLARVVVVGVAVAVAAVGLAGCGGGKGPGDEGPTATVPTTPPDPYAVPAVIDEAYVNRVLAALDQAVGDVVRMVVSTKTLSPEAIERLQAVYVGDALVLKLQGFQRDILDGLAGYKSNPGNKSSVVADLITGRSDCVFVQVYRDFSAVATNPDPRLARQWVSLTPVGSRANVGVHNPTPWVVTYDGFQKDLSAPPNPCVS